MKKNKEGRVLTIEVFWGGIGEECGEFQEVLHLVVDATEEPGEVVIRKSLEFPLHTIGRLVECEEFLEVGRRAHAVLVEDAGDAPAVLRRDFEWCDERIPLRALCAAGEGGGDVGGWHSGLEEGNRERKSDDVLCVEDVSWPCDERNFPPDPPSSTRADDVSAVQRPKARKCPKMRKMRMSTLCPQWVEHPITGRT